TCVRSDDGRGSAVERVGERSRVGGTTSQRNRLPAHCIAAITRVLVAKGSGQASKQARAELDVLLAQRGKPVLQQRHDPLVIGRAGKDETAAVPCSSAGERAREAETPGQAGRLEERLLRSGTVAGSCLRLAEREKKLAAHRVVFGARQLERLEGCL